MTNIDLYPLQDNYESKLSQPYDGVSSVIYVDSIPTATLPGGSKVLFTINPGTSFAQTVEVNGWSSGQLNVSSITVEKGNGINYSTTSHGAKSPIIISDNFAYWKEIATNVNTKADIASPVFTGIINGPTYSTLAALQIAYPSPTNGQQGAYCIAEGQYYDAVGGSRQPRVSGTNPNASTTTAGKVEIGTAAERAAGTSIGGSGAVLVVPNDALVKTSNVIPANDENKVPILDSTGKLASSFLPTVSSSAIITPLTAGIGMNQGYFFRNGINGNLLDLASNGGTVNYGGGIIGIGRDTASQAIGFVIPVENSGGLVQVTTSLLKTGTPTSNITLTLYSNNPGTTVVATSTNTIAESTLTGTASTQTFTFSNEAIVMGTSYYAKLSVPRANSSTNYSVLCGLATTPDNTFYISSTNVWTTFAGARANFSLTVNPGEVNTKKYRALANKTQFSNVEGGVQANVITDATFQGVLGGILGGFSGLTIGAIYYLTDAGGISTTPGTVSVKVGKAISTTQINFVAPLT